MLELAIVACLILLNGVFALSELAIVSSRRPRLRNLAASGKKGAQAALALSDDPGRFLSTVQIGITLIGVVSGAFSGAAFGGSLSDVLFDLGIPRAAADPLGYGGVVAIITYFSVVMGELVPKQFALRNPEAIASVVAPAMTLFSRIGAPAVWLLDTSTKLIFRLLGQKQSSDDVVTEEEIKSIVAEAEAAGVIEGDEKKMIGGVLRLSDRRARGLMTPRTDVDWIDLDQGEDVIRQKLIETPHSRLPVAGSGGEDMLGVVQSREMLAALLAGKPFNIRAHVRKAPVIPETMEALDVLTALQNADVPMALVLDEYGLFQGVVTPADVLEAIAGVFRSDIDPDDREVTRREDGSWLISGTTPADELLESIGLRLPPNSDYHTLAGLIIDELKHLPRTGEVIEAHGWRFEVVDMDGHRIDKVLASRLDG